MRRSKPKPPQRTRPGVKWAGPAIMLVVIVIAFLLIVVLPKLGPVSVSVPN